MTAAAVALGFILSSLWLLPLLYLWNRSQGQYVRLLEMQVQAQTRAPRPVSSVRRPAPVPAPDTASKLAKLRKLAGVEDEVQAVILPTDL